MAKTGIKITTTDTVLGAPIDVNTTSMIIVVGSSYNAPRKVYSTKDAALDSLSSYTKKCVEKYYSPAPGLSLEGNLLWVGSLADFSFESSHIEAQVRATVASTFDERPRQILICSNALDNVENDYLSIEKISEVQKALTSLQNEGIRCVAIFSTLEDDSSVTDCATFDAPFVSFCPMVDSDDFESSSAAGFSGSARVLGLLSSLSVGTSIGDGGLQPLQSPNIYITYSSDEIAIKGTDVRTLTLDRLNELGEAQQLFTRTRPPRNGLWWNDGATCNSADNALSTLEMARTICAIADELQSFFVPYINSRVPVTSTGDIQSAYKQVVLDNARAAVVQKYIENGDISDARISLVAKNNDMIGTRTWEVTLSILPAPTLRWIDGYVFYVKNLS